MELSRQAVIDYFENCDSSNFFMAYELVCAINSYDGSLDEISYYYNDDDFFAMAFGTNVLDAVRAVCYGDYRYSDDFVKFNGYGNLISANMYELISLYDLYKEDIADKIMELADVYFEYEELPECFFLN